MTHTVMTEIPRPEVAIAILHQSDRFLMQLRDNIPTITYPGHWAFFGGHLDPGESHEVAIHRELLEEINYDPPNLTYFRSYSDPQVIRHVYQAPLTVGLADIQLCEGWDMGFLTLEEIRQGGRCSEKAGYVCPLGKPHQQILLDFFREHFELPTFDLPTDDKTTSNPLK
jgi:8-oxo-dGTP diphosphatase